ncbi:MAG: hypothetical protein R3202_15265 [Candidatus Competibacterales bacterium]|nr:hypothetical protein [Candidatus Competibacterales bacterium]
MVQGGAGLCVQTVSGLLADLEAELPEAAPLACAVHPAEGEDCEVLLLACGDRF